MQKHLLPTTQMLLQQIINVGQQVTLEAAKLVETGQSLCHRVGSIARIGHEIWKAILPSTEAHLLGPTDLHEVDQRFSKINLK